jgi:hypothetical protein
MDKLELTLTEPIRLRVPNFDEQTLRLRRHNYELYVADNHHIVGVEGETVKPKAKPQGCIEGVVSTNRGPYMVVRDPTDESVSIQAVVDKKRILGDGAPESELTEPENQIETRKHGILPVRGPIHSPANCVSDGKNIYFQRNNYTVLAVSPDGAYSEIKFKGRLKNLYRGSQQAFAIEETISGSRINVLHERAINGVDEIKLADIIGCDGPHLYAERTTGSVKHIFAIKDGKMPWSIEVGKDDKILRSGEYVFWADPNEGIKTYYQGRKTYTFGCDTAVHQLQFVKWRHAFVTAGDRIGILYNGEMNPLTHLAGAAGQKIVRGTAIEDYAYFLTKDNEKLALWHLDKEEASYSRSNVDRM